MGNPAEETTGHPTVISTCPLFSNVKPCFREAESHIVTQGSRNPLNQKSRAGLGAHVPAIFDPARRQEVMQKAEFSPLIPLFPLVQISSSLWDITRAAEDNPRPEAI